MFKNFFDLGLESAGRTRFVVVVFFLFFIFLSDSILSYFTPYAIEEQHGAFMMGLIMSVSSIAGILFDFIFPQFVNRVSVNKLIFFTILANILFISALILYSLSPFILFVLMGVISWGIYFELLGFSRQQFVANSISHQFHASAWGILETVRGFAYMAGSFITSLALVKGQIPTLLIAAMFTAGALILFVFRKKRHSEEVLIKSTKANLWDEFDKWKLLLSKTKIIIATSVLISLIDATVWTVGVVWAEKIAHMNYWGDFFIPVYEFPILLLGLLIAKIGITSGKKVKSELTLLASGIALSCLYFLTEPVLFIFVVLIMSIFLTISYTLNAAVFSNLEERMGIEKRHLIGLSQSTASFSYIVGPILAGTLASRVGEQMTFVYVGLFVALSSAFLFLITPKKIKLPQREIHGWK